MSREFPTSIYSGFSRPRQRPTYHKVSLLAVVRAERRLAPKMQRVESINKRYRTVHRIMDDALAGSEAA